jgi:hypothetical protein
MVSRFVYGVLALAGCSEEPTLSHVQPIAEISPRALDFGAVPISATRHMPITIRNTGFAPLIVEGAIDGPFALGAIPAEIQPGQIVQLDVGFRPAALPEVGTVLSLATNDPDRADVIIDLRGSGGAGLVDVRPPLLDLGEVPIFTAARARLVFGNRGDAMTGRLVAVGFQRPEHFGTLGLDAFAAPVELAIGASAHQIVEVEYRPLAAGSDRGSLLLETCGEMCGVEADIVASARTGVVRIEPAFADFGPVDLGQQKRITIAIQNDDSDPVTLERVESGSSEVIVSSDALPASIAGGAITHMHLDYRPASARELDGTVQVHVARRGEVSVFSVGLAGHGEGPLFAIQPSALDFGTVDRSDVSRRALLLTNVGSSIVSVTAAAIGGNPAFRLAASTRFPVRLAHAESVSIYVELEPADLGLHTATLVVTSDDPRHPAIDVPLAADVIDQKCDLIGLPPTISFGEILDGTPRTISATIQQLGPDPCTITDAGFRAPSSPDISANLSTFPVVIAPGASLDVEFTMAPSVLGEQHALFVVTTDDGLEYRSLLDGLFGAVCDGYTSPCGCVGGQKKLYTRYDPLAPSGVSVPADGSAPYRISCADGFECPAGQVLVETSPGTLECAPPPPDCGPGYGIDWEAGAWSCVDCSVIVQYGFLYDGRRACAIEPDVTCPGNQVPTYKVETERWECAPTCDNGQYDQIVYDGELVCVPC